MRHIQLGRVLINFGFPSLSFTKSAGSVVWLPFFLNQGTKHFCETYVVRNTGGVRHDNGRKEANSHMNGTGKLVSYML